MKAGSEEMAAASADAECGPVFSDASLNCSQPTVLAGFFGLDSMARSVGVQSGGIQIGEYPFRTLVCTSMPWLTAVASTYGLKDEPTGSGASAMLYWQYTPVASLLVRHRSPGRRRSARMAPGRRVLQRGADVA